MGGVGGAEARVGGEEAVRARVGVGVEAGGGEGGGEGAGVERGVEGVGVGGLEPPSSWGEGDRGTPLPLLLH
jgi:hypothetical protein